jgi:amino acid transporter
MFRIVLIFATALLVLVLTVVYGVLPASAHGGTDPAPGAPISDLPAAVDAGPGLLQFALLGAGVFFLAAGVLVALSRRGTGPADTTADDDTSAA